MTTYIGSFFDTLCGAAIGRPAFLLFLGTDGGARRLPLLTKGGAPRILMIASGNCTIMYRCHGVAVTDEGLASPFGRGAGGGEGDFYPLSRLRRQLPQRGSQGGRGKRIATPVLRHWFAMTAYLRPVLLGGQRISQGNLSESLGFFLLFFRLSAIIQR